jgi:predicted deacylase
MPRTGFELRNGKGWTTLAEEQRYVDALDSASTRVRVVLIGTTLQRRAIRMLVVGPPRSQAPIANGSAALFVCTQHGNEPAAREACLQRARDIATSTSTQTVLVIPTANPDGVAANTRANAAGVDVNRTHERLGSAEARAIAAVMAAYKPDVLGDLHEYAAAGEWRVRTRNDRSYPAAVTPRIKALAIHLTHRYQEPAINAGGYATASYAADVIPSGLIAVSATKHIVSVLTETPRAGRLTPQQRVDAQRRSIDGTLHMLGARGRDLAAATAGPGPVAR